MDECRHSLYCIVWVLECTTILRTKRHIGWHSFIAIYRLAVSSFSKKGHICKYKEEEKKKKIIFCCCWYFSLSYNRTVELVFYKKENKKLLLRRFSYVHLIYKKENNLFEPSYQNCLISVRFRLNLLSLFIVETIFASSQANLQTKQPTDEIILWTWNVQRFVFFFIFHFFFINFRSIKMSTLKLQALDENRYY